MLLPPSFVDALIAVEACETVQKETGKEERPDGEQAKSERPTLGRSSEARVHASR